MNLNINIDSKILKKILISVYKVAYSSNIKNNLFNIEITKNELIIMVDNEMVAIKKTTKDLEVIEPGKFVINGYIMNELCQKFEGNVNIKMNGENVVHFASGKSKNRVNIMDFQMFRKISFDIEGTQINLPENTFSKIVKQISYATQGKDGRTTFQGINIRVFKKKLIATATDGSRIARRILLNNVVEEIDLIVPVLFFSEVNRLSEKDIEKKAIFSSDQILVFIDEDTKILTKTFSEVFPDTESQLQQEWETEIECNCEEIIKAIERIGVINEKDEIPSVVFKVKEGKFLLSSTTNNEIGYSEEEVVSVKIVGKDQNSTLQVKYVINALRGFDKEKILIQFSPKNGPVFLKMKEDDSAINLILPFWNY